MAESLSPEALALIRAQTAAGRDQVEQALSGPRRGRGVYRFLVGLLGALAVAALAAGIAIFLTAIVLNLLFHYAPS